MHKEIISAAKKGDAASVKALLTKDKRLTRAKDKDGSTPPHCAAWKGHLEVVRILLDAGAEIEAQNQNSHWGMTPLHAASHGNQKAVVEVLIEHGADVNAKSPLNFNDSSGALGDSQSEGGRRSLAQARSEAVGG